MLFTHAPTSGHTEGLEGLGQTIWAGIGRAWMAEESPSLGCVVSGDHRIITTLAYPAVCSLLRNGQEGEKGTEPKASIHHGLLCSEKAHGPRLRPTSIKDAYRTFSIFLLSI